MLRSRLVKRRAGHALYPADEAWVPFDTTQRQISSYHTENGL